MRILTLVGIGALLVLTTVLGMDVGVASLVIATVLIVLDSGVQKPAVESMPWSAIILVTGIVTYVGMLEEMGALKELEAGIAGLGNSSLAALITSYVVAIVSAFASTTGTLVSSARGRADRHGSAPHPDWCDYGHRHQLLGG